MILLFLFYFLPMSLVLFMAYKCKTDALFATKVEIKSYIGLSVLIMLAFIPLANIVGVCWLIMTLSTNNYFTENKKWRLHK